MSYIAIVCYTCVLVTEMVSYEYYCHCMLYLFAFRYVNCRKNIPELIIRFIVEGPLIVQLYCLPTFSYPREEDYLEVQETRRYTYHGLREYIPLLET